MPSHHKNNAPQTRKAYTAEERKARRDMLALLHTTEKGLRDARRDNQKWRRTERMNRRHMIREGMDMAILDGGGAPFPMENQARYLFNCLRLR